MPIDSEVAALLKDRLDEALTETPLPEASAIKGASCISVIAVARETFGEQAFSALLDRLPFATQELVQRRLLSIEWIPMRLWFPFTQALFEHCLGSDEAKLRALSRRICERDFGRLYRFFLSPRSPAFIFEHVATIWSTYARGGHLEMLSEERQGARKIALMRLAGFSAPALFAVVVQGYIEQILAMAGAKDIETEIVRRDGQDASLVCEFRVSYV